MKSIVLVGFMGSGKTTIGRKLAKRLGMRFVDTDEAIEWETGKTVAEIFESEGEGYFRMREAEVFRRLVKEKPLVIAAGGGALENAGIRKLCRDACTTIYLASSFENIMKRVDRLRPSRPLLKSKRPSEIRQLFDARMKHYSECDFTVEVDGLSQDSVVEKIIYMLETC